MLSGGLTEKASMMCSSVEICFNVLSIVSRAIESIIDIQRGQLSALKRKFKGEKCITMGDASNIDVMA